MGCRQQSTDERTIIVFAAASLREALYEVASIYEAEKDYRIVFNLAGSNVLARQLAASPSASDLFISADTSWITFLDERELLANESRINILANALSIVGHPSTKVAIISPCELQFAMFGTLALGDPRGVPAGRYAKAWMSSRVCGEHSLWDHLREKVAPASDVRGVVQMVRASPKVLGIVYASDVFAYSDRIKVIYNVPSDSTDILYAAARMAASPNPNAATDFLRYLSSESAQRVFASHGFLTSFSE